MKKPLILMGLLLIVLSFSGCMRTAGPGEVGIKVNLAGDHRGVEDLAIETGRIFYFPPTQQVIVYPTHRQVARWTRDPVEGSKNNEEIQFSSKEGLTFTADVGMEFDLDPDKVPQLYVRYRKPIADIIAENLRTRVRTVINTVTQTMEAGDIYGPRKSHVEEEATRILNEELGDLGFNIHYVAFIGNPRPPENLVESINEQIAATHRAIQRENELREAQAEAEKQVAEAEGRARARIADASGLAEAIMIEAEAQAEAHRLLVESLGGPEHYVALESINKLNDQVQVLMVPSGSTPLLGLDGLFKPEVPASQVVSP